MANSTPKSPSQHQSSTVYKCTVRLSSLSGLGPSSLIPATKASVVPFAPGSYVSLWCIAAGPATDLIFTDDLWDCQSLDKTVLATHPLWTCKSPVLYPQSRQQTQVQQATSPVSDTFKPVSWHIKQSPVPFPIPHSFLFGEGAPWTPPAELLHLCRKKLTCQSILLVPAQAILETIILHQFRLGGWLIMCPRDSTIPGYTAMQHYMNHLLDLQETEEGLELFYLPRYICSSNLIDGKPLFSSMSLNSLHWNIVFSCDCDSCFFPIW